VAVSRVLPRGGGRAAFRAGGCAALDRAARVVEGDPADGVAVAQPTEARSPMRRRVTWCSRGTSTTGGRWSPRSWRRRWRWLGQAEGRRV